MCNNSFMGNGSPGSGTATMSSVTNALRILDSLAQDTSLRVVDVARQLGVADSTAHRLLTALRERGYVIQRPGSAQYEPGPAALRLARRFNTERTLERIAMPHLVALGREVNETVNLQVLVGHEVLFIATVEDSHQLRVAMRAGTRAPSHANAGGKYLLAQLPDDEVRRLLDGRLDPLTTHTVTTVDQLLTQLREVRRMGYALNTGETDEGVRAVAVGVPDFDGTTLAALTMAAPSMRLPSSRIRTVLPHLRRCAEAIADAYRGSTNGAPRRD
jgi:DNA-binding IclR family transcriptional regulator